MGRRHDDEENMKKTTREMEWNGEQQRTNNVTNGSE